MSDYRQAIVNEDGELLGYDYVYADEDIYDDPDYGMDDYDDEDMWSGDATDAASDSAYPETDLGEEWL